MSFNMSCDSLRVVLWRRPTYVNTNYDVGGTTIQPTNCPHYQCHKLTSALHEIRQVYY